MILYFAVLFIFSLRNSPCAARKELPSRRKPAEANGPCTTSFRMTSFSLARSVTNRRADGGPSDSSLIKITYCQQTPQKHGRRLRGIQFLPCIQWTKMNIHVHSCPFVSIRGSVTFVQAPAACVSHPIPPHNQSNRRLLPRLDGTE